MICEFKLPFPNKYFQVLGKKNKFLLSSMEKSMIIATQVLQPGLKKLIFYVEPELKYKEKNSLNKETTGC